MKKTMKKFFAGLLSAALIVGGFGIQSNAAQATDGLADGTAYLNINNSDWGDFDAEWTNAEITGDGDYVVSMVASSPVDLAQFNALEVVNGEATIGNAAVLTVTSVKINGNEVKSADSYTCSADGAGVTTRVNIYNEWNSPDATLADNRCADGDVTTKAACLFDSSLLTGVESVEVAFTVSDFGKSVSTATGAATPFEGTFDAFVAIGADAADENDWAAQYYGAGNGSNTANVKEAVDATVSNGETFTISVEFDAPVRYAWFFAPALCLGDTKVDAAASSFDVKVFIDDVDVTETVDFSAGDMIWEEGTGDAGTHRLAGGYNEWGTKYIATSPEGFSKIAYEITANIMVQGEVVEEGPQVDPVDLNGKYNAYFGFQTPVFSFRNAFDDATYGRDTDFFNVVTGWDADNNAVTKAGTFTDAVIEGNGTYTVSVSGLDLAGEFDSQDYFNLLFLSTDIPNSGEITISDMVLTIDGKTVEISPVLSPDSKLYVNMLIQNIWNDSVKTIGAYNVPPTEMSITFTVSGFAYDKAVEEEVAAPAETETTTSVEETTTPAPAPEKSGSNAWIWIVVAIVAAAACACAVVVVKKKKK